MGEDIQAGEAKAGESRFARNDNKKSKDNIPSAPFKQPLEMRSALFLNLS